MRSSLTVLLLALTLALPCFADETSNVAEAASAGTIPADAADPSGDISRLIVEGRVADATEAIIPGAKVELLSTSGRPVATTASDEHGNFRFEGVPAGSYDLRVTYKGFESRVQRVTIAEGHGLNASVTLAAASVHETVNVTAQPAYSEPNAVSATRMDIPVRDVPQSIGVINSELIRAQGVTSMQEAVRNVPGVSVHLGEGRRDQVLIRGFSALNDQYVDGVRDDSAYYRDLSNVERIEVVKGPASVLYGRGSSGGIVNRVTKSPVPGGVLGEISTMAGTYGTKRLSTDLGAPLFSDKAAFRLTGAFENSGTFRHYTALDRYALSPSVLWQPTQRTRMVFQSDNLYDDRVPDRGVPSINGRPADVNIGNYYGDPKNDYLRNKVFGQTLRVEHNTSRWSLRNNFRHTFYNNAYSNTQPNGTTTVNGVTMVLRDQYNNAGRQHNYFDQAEASTSATTFGIGHKLLFGAEYGRQMRNSAVYRGKVSAVDLNDPILTPAQFGTAPSTNNEFTGTVAGVYVQDLLDLGGGWKALVGGRFDYFKQSLDDLLAANVDLSRIDRQFSPRAGVVYQPKSWVSLYTSYSRSFQPSGEGLSLAANASELKPEVTSNYEGGAKFDFFNGRVGSTVSVFRLDRNNVKTTDPANPTRLLSVGLQRTDGFEVSVTGRVLKNLDVVGGYALLGARTLRSNTVSSGVLLQGKRASMVPRNSFNLWSTYSFDNGFGFGGGVIYNDVRYAEANNLVLLPSFTRVDATVFYRKSRYDIALNLRNVGNIRYYESAHSNNQIMPGSPINGTLTTRLRW